MRTFSATERQLLLAIARRVIERIASEEVEFFSDLAEEYFSNPVPPEVGPTLIDDPLASGLNSFLAPASLAALAMTSTALDYVREKGMANNSSDSMNFTGIAGVLANQTLMQELRERLEQTGQEYRLPAPQAHAMADELLDALRSLEAEAAIQRTINAWIDGIAPHQPLTAGQVYKLCFDVAPARRDALVLGAAVDDVMALLAPEQEQIEVTVLLTSTYVELREPHQQTLVVPRRGSSANVQFEIVPLTRGWREVQVHFFIENQLFYQMKIELHVGEGYQGDALRIHTAGRGVEAALEQHPRRNSISLLLLRRDAGFSMMLKSDAGVKSAHISISESEIDDMLKRSRDVLHDIVHASDTDGRLIYQHTNTTVLEKHKKDALEQLAELGSYLYSKLFYGRDGDVRAIGDLLREIMRTKQVYIDIIAEHFIFPWTLLYIGEDFRAPDMRHFWGFQHFVAYMPHFSTATAEQLDTNILIDGQLQLGFVCDHSIDKHQQIVSRQRQFFQRFPQVQVNEYWERQGLLNLLSHGAHAAHVIYCYCHAESVLPGEKGGVSNSRLILTDGPITLYDLELYAPASKPPLTHAPLVFLNACESARLSPYLYDGLLPYLIKRGARGVVGTEVDTPVFFAAEFAQNLFSQWMTGNTSLGEVVLQLRRKYLLEKHNVLGLLYSLYVGSDLALVWRDRH